MVSISDEIKVKNRASLFQLMLTVSEMLKYTGVSVAEKAILQSALWNKIASFDDIKEYTKYTDEYTKFCEANTNLACGMIIDAKTLGKVDSEVILKGLKALAEGRYEDVVKYPNPVIAPGAAKILEDLGIEPAKS